MNNSTRGILLGTLLMFMNRLRLITLNLGGHLRVEDSEINNGMVHSIAKAVP